jgi:hypothetical protein
MSTALSPEQEHRARKDKACPARETRNDADVGLTHGMRAISGGVIGRFRLSIFSRSATVQIWCRDGYFALGEQASYNLEP